MQIHGEGIHGAAEALEQQLPAWRALEQRFQQGTAFIPESVEQPLRGAAQPLGPPLLGGLGDLGGLRLLRWPECVLDALPAGMQMPRDELREHLPSGLTLGIHAAVAQHRGDEHEAISLQLALTPVM